MAYRLGELMEGLRTSVNVVAHLDAKFGGMSASVPALAQATAATDRYSALLLAFCEGDEAHEVRDASHFRTMQFPIDGFRPLSDFIVRSRLRPIVRSCDVVHVHGIWRAHCAASGQISRRHHKPVVVSAHGMLDSWALRNKQWKKALYSALVERSNLQSAACLRALTRAEVENYRSFGLTNPVALIPNGVSAPKQFSPDRFFEKYRELEGRRVVLFLSRIHYKKGIDLLCQAWAAVCAQFPDAHLVLAGPDFENTLQKTVRLVNTLGIEDRVTFTGMLAGQDKWDALAAATLFVLPSWSEGFSVATLEAMAASRPVIITHQCYFPEVAEHRCGWLIQPDVRELETALAEALNTPQSELDRLGENGKRLVAERFTWGRVGQQMVQVYDWILGGPKPSIVEVFE